MSIGMDRFGSVGQFASYNPFVLDAERVTVFQMQCRCCGYESTDPVVAPKICPKCHSQSWERFARPGSILADANRSHANNVLES